MKRLGTAFLLIGLTLAGCRHWCEPDPPPYYCQPCVPTCVQPTTPCTPCAPSSTYMQPSTTYASPPVTTQPPANSRPALPPR